MRDVVVVGATSRRPVVQCPRGREALAASSSRGGEQQQGGASRSQGGCGCRDVRSSAAADAVTQVATQVTPKRIASTPYHGAHLVTYHDHRHQATTRQAEPRAWGE